MGSSTRASPFLAVLGLLLMQDPSPGAASAPPSRDGATIRSGQIILTPDVVTDERDRTLSVRRGLLFVPENRRAPASRLIAIHFIVFPAAQPVKRDRAPVFLLPGGPGWDIDFSDPLWFDEIERLRRTRNVVYVSQRGYAGAPGLVPDLRVSYPARSPDMMVPAQARAEQDREILAQAFSRWSASGVDLAGYDILNITADVNDLRRALGHEKIVLRGCSFGSQWSLAYMARWPETVDRAVLSGVEPLDYGYDSPDWIWASMARVARAAEIQPRMAARIPEGGVMMALRTVISRLEAASVTVTIRDPAGAGDLRVPVGADDLRAVLTDLSLGKRRPRENLAQWPRFVLEMYAGDFRFLAVRTAETRARSRTESLLLATMNHSVGIDADRAARLFQEPAATWLGDINLKESVTRSRAPTPQVDDAFRQERTIDIPTLLIAGDYDWSTPIENAERLSALLTSGKLVTIEGGRHCTETNYGELSMEQPSATNALYGFIDRDFGQAGATAFFATLPSSIELPSISFTPPSGTSLYDEWLARRR